MKPFLYARGTKNYARFLVPAHLQASLGKRFLVFALGEGAGYEIRLKAHQLEHYLRTKLLQNGSMKKLKPRRLHTAKEFDVSVDDDGIHFKDIGSDEDLRMV